VKARIKRRELYPTVCGRCMGAIDRLAVLRAIRFGERYVHECGRVLAEAKS